MKVLKFGGTSLVDSSIMKKVSKIISKYNNAIIVVSAFGGVTDELIRAGNPSNFYRILDLYKNNIELMKKDITSFSFSDNKIRNTIKRVFFDKGYVLDPHGAVGYLGLKNILIIEMFLVFS